MVEGRKPPSRKGVSHSKETIERIRQAISGKPKPEFSEQAIENMRRGQQRRQQRRREQQAQRDQQPPDTNI